MGHNRTWKPIAKTVATITLITPFHGKVLWVMTPRNEYVVHEAIGLTKGRLNGLEVRIVADIEDTTHLEIIYLRGNIANAAIVHHIFNANGVVQIIQMTSEQLHATFLLSSIVTRLKVANTAPKVKRLHFASNTLMKLQTS